MEDEQVTFGFNTDQAVDEPVTFVRNSHEDLSKAILILGTTLSHIVNESNEADTVRVALRGMLRTGIVEQFSEELGV